jgi:hypothetical protein
MAGQDPAYDWQLNVLIPLVPPKGMIRSHE